MGTILSNEPEEDTVLSTDTAEAAPHIDKDNKKHTNEIPQTELEEYSIPAVQIKTSTTEDVHKEENSCRVRVSADTADAALLTDVLDKTHKIEILPSETNKNLQTDITSSLNTRTSDEDDDDNQYNTAPAQIWRGNTIHTTNSYYQQLHNTSKALRQRKYYSSKTYYKKKITKPHNTQPRQRKICVYYLNDCCIFGKSCFNIHEDTPLDDHDDTNANEGTKQTADSTSPFRAGAQHDWANSEYW